MIGFVSKKMLLMGGDSGTINQPVLVDFGYG